MALGLARLRATPAQPVSPAAPESGARDDADKARPISLESRIT